MKTRANVKGLGKVVEVIGAFDKELRELRQEARKRGVKLRTPVITPRDEAYARIQTKNAKQIGKNYGTRTTAGFEYMKGELPILRKRSRLLNQRLAKKVVEANKKKEYLVTDSTKEYERDRKIADKEEKQGKAPNERSVIVLPSRDNFNIIPEENWQVLASLLEDQAEPYFVLHENYRGIGIPITTYLVSKGTVDAQDGTLMTQLLFRSLVGRSGLDGGFRSLDCYGRARGVLEKTSKAGSRPRKAPTQRQIDTQLKLIREVRTGDRKASELEKALKFLENLKQ